MRDYIPNKKEHRSDYFKVIDSEVKAYILGYIVADGSIEESVRKNRPSKLIRLRFGCVTEDDELIKLVQREIAPMNKLRYYQPKQVNHKQVTILQICDKELINVAYLVLVALDDEEQPVEVPKLLLETEEEKAEWDAAAKRRQVHRGTIDIRQRFGL